MTGGGFDHRPGAARRTGGTALSRRGDEKVVTALGAASAAAPSARTRCPFSFWRLHPPTWGVGWRNMVAMGKLLARQMRWTVIFDTGSLLEACEDQSRSHSTDRDGSHRWNCGASSWCCWGCRSANRPLPVRCSDARSMAASSLAIDVVSRRNRPVRTGTV